MKEWKCRLPFANTCNRVPKCDVTKNKFLKLWDLVPFSSKASLEKGPWHKLPLNCNSQPKYKGWKLILLHKNLSNFELVPNWRNQNKFWRVCIGCYQTLIPYISIGKCNSELIFGMRASLRILYKNMTSYSIISKKYIFVTSSLRYSIVLEIFKFEKCLKYANDMTDDVIYSTQYYIKYINRAILVNLQWRLLKFGRLIVLQKTHLLLSNILFPWQLTLFQFPPTWFQYISDFQLEKR